MGDLAIVKRIAQGMTMKADAEAIAVVLEAVRILLANNQAGDTLGMAVADLEQAMHALIEQSRTEDSGRARRPIRDMPTFADLENAAIEYGQVLVQHMIALDLETRAKTQLLVAALEAGVLNGKNETARRIQIADALAGSEEYAERAQETIKLAAQKAELESWIALIKARLYHGAHRIAIMGGSLTPRLARAGASFSGGET